MGRHLGAALSQHLTHLLQRRTGAERGRRGAESQRIGAHRHRDVILSSA